jgi:hypothetical protein
MGVASRAARLGVAAAWVGVVAACAGPPTPLAGQGTTDEPAVLYRAALLQAAPGRLLDLIAVLRARFPEDDPASPLVMRHSQGDHWDLMILGPASELESGLSNAAPPDLLALVRGRPTEPPEASEVEAVEQPLAADSLDALLAWSEDLWAWGPPVRTFRDRARGAGFFHIEMFVALAGRRAGLVEQRRMENEYLRRIGLSDNLLWVRHAGADWDAFTIGFYRDLAHYAEPSPVDPAMRDAITVEVGFPEPGSIGAYLRRFLLRHNDTLAGVAR